jgi:hypothetical protein
MMLWSKIFADSEAKKFLCKLAEGYRLHKFDFIGVARSSDVLSPTSASPSPGYLARLSKLPPKMNCLSWLQLRPPLQAGWVAHDPMQLGKRATCRHVLERLQLLRQ